MNTFLGASQHLPPSALDRELIESARYKPLVARTKVFIIDADLLPAFEQVIDKIPNVEKLVIATEPGFEGWSTAFGDAVDYEGELG